MPLPGELLGMLAGYLDLADVGRLALTSRHAYVYTLGDPYTRNRLRARLGFAQCVKRGWVGAVRLLLADPRVDPTAGDNAAIQLAIWAGHPDVVALLLADGRVDPTAHDNEAIQGAAAGGRTEIVRLLLADGRADPATYGNWAIQAAAGRGHMEVVRLLLADDRVRAAGVPPEILGQYEF